MFGVFFYYNKIPVFCTNVIIIFFQSSIICCREIPFSKLDSVGLVSVILKVLYTFAHACEDEAIVGHEPCVRGGDEGVVEVEEPD